MDAFSGDEFKMNIKFNSNEWGLDLPQKTEFRSKRNSVIVFENLVLPCNDIREVKITEDDLFSSTPSKSIRFDCSKRGIHEGIFQIGDDPAIGQYKIIYAVFKIPGGSSFSEKH